MTLWNANDLLAGIFYADSVAAEAALFGTFTNIAVIDCGNQINGLFLRTHSLHKQPSKLQLKIWGAFSMHELCALLDANIVNEFSDFACLYITNFGGILAGLCDLPEEALMGEWFALVQRLRRCLVRASGVLGACSEQLTPFYMGVQRHF